MFVIVRRENIDNPRFVHNHGPDLRLLQFTSNGRPVKGKMISSFHVDFETLVALRQVTFNELVAVIQEGRDRTRMPRAKVGPGWGGAATV